MPILDNTQLQAILDKLARFAAEAVGDIEFNPAFTAGIQTASLNTLSGGGALAAYIISLSDEDIMADLLPAARTADQTNPTLIAGYLTSITSVAAILHALDAHFHHFSYASVDAYLTEQNLSTPTLRAHGHFRKHLKLLSAKNCFIPNDLDIATCAITGSAAGTYAHVAAVDSTKYAGAKLVVKNVGALTTGPTIGVVVTLLDGTSDVLTATISTLTDAHETDLSDVTQLYVDVTGIGIVSGGTNGDHIKIVAKTDRSVAAA